MTHVAKFRLGAIALLGLGLAGLATSAGIANSTAPSDTCGITSTTQNGMLLIQGAVLSPVALTGEYKFSLQSAGHGGSSTINQGGAFTAAANEPTTIGQVTINAGSTYTVALGLKVDGKILDCSQDFLASR